MTASQWARMGVLMALLVVLTAATGVWGLVVVLGIVVMVFLHELGHYVVAKRSGMKVTEFFIGFGPRIWSFRRGETEYGLKVVPAGAYVRIVGMHNLEEVDPADEARSYRQGRFRNRFAVVVAGPAMNLLTALVLIWLLLAVVGVPGGRLTGTLDETRWSIDSVYPGTGAAAAGIRKGDRITAIDGTRVVTVDDLQALVRPRRGETVQVTALRAGRTFTVRVALRPYTATQGARACCLGIQSRVDAGPKERVNPIVAVPRSVSTMGTLVGKSLAALGNFFSPSGLRDFGRQVATANDDPTTTPSTSPSSGSSTGSGSGSSTSSGDNRLVGLVGVFQIGTAAAQNGIVALALLFVLLNISLGIINLVPLLPFDGGHASIAVYEKLQEKRRHLKGRYFTDVARLLPLTYVVVLVLVGIFVTTNYLDIANPLDVGR